MSIRVVEAVGLGKTYRIPTGGESGYRTLREELRGITMRRRRRRTAQGEARVLHAVRDLSMNIDAGEALGLVGRNGAGKSTVMKMFARVTKPTSGYADIFGRVGALLEVGTGFHPELSGRENVHLSGTILGMSKKDVAASFDDIVSFAELDSFIDLPVKRYSSGMYARLGFAVAAHLRPSLLIVDEVLAVGDLPFQAKCLAHMKALTAEGVAVIFVSHNLLAVADFCQRVAVMTAGRLSFDGAAPDGIAHYRESLVAARGAGDPSGFDAPSVLVDGVIADVVSVKPGTEVSIEVQLDVPSSGESGEITLNFMIETFDGRVVVHLRNDFIGTRLYVQPGRNVVGVVLNDLSLVPGEYSLWLRAVSLNPRSPWILDTERLLLAVEGDRFAEAIALPRHSFHVRPAVDSGQLARPASES